MHEGTGDLMEQAGRSMKRFDFADAWAGTHSSQAHGIRLHAEMNHVVPRLRQRVLIEPCYPKPGSGRCPMCGEHPLRCARLHFVVFALLPAARQKRRAAGNPVYAVEALFRGRRVVGDRALREPVIG
jgi:hypothetical protein